MSGIASPEWMSMSDRDLKEFALRDIERELAELEQKLVSFHAFREKRINDLKERKIKVEEQLGLSTNEMPPHCRKDR